jgi:geranylgeranyl diphosphate synthase type I
MPSRPPHQLLDVAAKVETRLDQFFTSESARWRELDPRLAEAVDELASVLRSGGKRLRAAFCYWAWHGAGGGSDGSDTGEPHTQHPAGDSDGGEPHTQHRAGDVGMGPAGWGAEGRAEIPVGESAVVDAGAAFELLQAFALIHDDIMDDSATRRGRPTVHTKQARRLADLGWQGEPRRFGEGVAILIGDLGHAYADQLMAGIDPAARRIWDELRIELNLGQYLDLRSAAATELDRDTARRVSTFKSALYTIVRPLQLGVSLHGRADPDLLAKLDRFGRPLGRAFQLKDDLLGVLGDEAAIGKPVGDDLREGKPTELVALAVHRADGNQRRLLAGLGRRDLNGDDVSAIVDVFRSTGAVEEIVGRIADLVAEAVTVVPDLPFDDQAKKALEALADYVAARNS